MMRGWTQNMLARLQRKAETKGAARTLFFLAFIESIFFPIPPDLLLIPLGLAARRQVFRLAAICLTGSVLGGTAGYLIGYFFMDVIGMFIVQLYGLEDGYFQMQEWYRDYDVLAVAVGAISPIPYKLVALTAGAFKINLATFIIVSALSRGVRFFAEAALIYFLGERIRHFLEKRFDLVLLLGLVLVVAGFVAVKYLPNML
jgi:membrane protein YqaA with SNARE-associated domain